MATIMMPFAVLPLANKLAAIVDSQSINCDVEGRKIPSTLRGFATVTLKGERLPNLSIVLRLFVVSWRIVISRLEKFSYRSSKALGPCLER